MTVVTVSNRSTGLKIFNDVHKRQISVKPGTTKDIDMDTHHVILLQHEAARKGSGIELKIHDEGQFESDAEAIAEAKAAGPRQGKMGETFITQRIPPGFGDDDGGGPQEPERSADPQLRDQPPVTTNVNLEESYPIEGSGAKAAAPERGEDQGSEHSEEEQHEPRRARAKSHRRPARE